MFSRVGELIITVLKVEVLSLQEEGATLFVARFVRPCKIVCEDFHSFEMIVAHSWTYKSRPPCFLHASEQTQCWQWKRAIAAPSTVLGIFRNMTTYNMQNSAFHEMRWWIHHSSEPGRLMFL